MCVGDQKAAWESYLQALKEHRVCIIESEPETWLDARTELMEELEEIQLDDDLDHKTEVGTSVSPKLIRDDHVLMG